MKTKKPMTELDAKKAVIQKIAATEAERAQVANAVNGCSTLHPCQQQN